jgi:tRNA pseudouridine55 synthase
VSSGTYIRSLVDDIGKSLKTGAYMSALRRTKVGVFSVVDAVGPDALEPGIIESKLIEVVKK